MSRRYYVRVTWMNAMAQAQVPGAPGAGAVPSVVPCYVEVSTDDPPGSEGSQELRKAVAAVVREQVERYQRSLATPSLDVRKYAQELFDTLVEQFADREVRVDTPLDIFVSRGEAGPCGS